MPGPGGKYREGRERERESTRERSAQVMKDLGRMKKNPDEKEKESERKRRINNIEEFKGSVSRILLTIREIRIDRNRCGHERQSRNAGQDCFHDSLTDSIRNGWIVSRLLLSLLLSSFSPSSSSSTSSGAPGGTPTQPRTP